MPLDESNQAEFDELRRIRSASETCAHVRPWPICTLRAEVRANFHHHVRGNARCLRQLITLICHNYFHLG